MMSRFLIALLFFLSLGFLTVKFVQPIKGSDNSTNPQEKTWTEWALADFNKQKNKPLDIVIIGSSLVLTPINLADAHFKNSIVNGALHHKSDLLRAFLSGTHNTEADCRTPDNFNFALPGLMPSDAYLITKLLLTGKDHPKLLVYGVGPRDFLDNLLANPASTDPYKCLSKYLPAEDKDHTLALYQGRDWQAHVDYFLGQHFPIYGQKNKILAFCSKHSQILYAHVLPLVSGRESASEINEFSIADLHNLLPSYNPMAIGINQCLFQPVIKLEADRFNKNLNEYRLRYGKINWNTFTCQATFFMNVLKMARDNNIQVLVVAMPITSVNRELLPEHIFALYKNNLRVFSKSFGANFLDLDGMNCFNDQDFGDTVHLSTTGSTKMIKLISDYIVEHDLVKMENPDHSHIAETGVKL